jgi:hypothetical protein
MLLFLLWFEVSEWQNVRERLEAREVGMVE